MEGLIINTAKVLLLVTHPGVTHEKCSSSCYYLVSKLATASRVIIDTDEENLGSIVVS